MAGTGCGRAEVMALRRQALDLDADTVTIDANVVGAHGQGILLQDHVKTRPGVWTTSVPRAVPKMLIRRSKNKQPHSKDLVFPTVLGNIRGARNTSRDWREARDRLGHQGVTAHCFRKTFATGLDTAGLSAREIADYLGHENPSLTQDV